VVVLPALLPVAALGLGGAVHLMAALLVVVVVDAALLPLPLLVVVMAGWDNNMRHNKV
jgi:hypothetical protein